MNNLYRVFTESNIYLFAGKRMNKKHFKEPVIRYIKLGIQSNQSGIINRIDK